MSAIETLARRHKQTDPLLSLRDEAPEVTRSALEFSGTYRDFLRKPLTLKTPGGFILYEANKADITDKVTLLSLWISGSSSVSHEQSIRARGVFAEAFAADLLRQTIKPDSLQETDLEVIHAPYVVDTHNWHGKNGDLILARKLAKNRFDPLLLIDVTMQSKSRRQDSRIPDKQPPGINDLIGTPGVNLYLGDMRFPVGKGGSSKDVYTYLNLLRDAVKVGIYSPFTSLSPEAKSGLKQDVEEKLLRELEVFSNDPVLEAQVQTRAWLKIEEAQELLAA